MHCLLQFQEQLLAETIKHSSHQKRKGNNILFIINQSPSGFPAANGKTETINETLLAAECLDCKFGEETLIIDLSTSEELKKYYPDFKPKDNETLILTSRGELITAIVAKKSYRYGSGTGEYWVEEGEILIGTNLADKERYVADYYEFRRGGTKVLMNIVMLVALTGMKKESNIGTDHINGDTSDNRLENLCPLTPQKNLENREWIDYRQMLANHIYRSVN